MDIVLSTKQTFLNSSTCPEIHGHLHAKEQSRKSWKKFYFVLRRSGLYFSNKGTSKVSKTKWLGYRIKHGLFVVDNLKPLCCMQSYVYMFVVALHWSWTLGWVKCIFCSCTVIALIKKLLLVHCGVNSSSSVYIALSRGTGWAWIFLRSAGISFRQKQDSQSCWQVKLIPRHPTCQHNHFATAFISYNSRPFVVGCRKALVWRPLLL